MSDTRINDDCVLIEITNEENSFYKKGYRYLLEGKILGSKTMLLTPAEFNALASYAPLFKRMVNMIKDINVGDCPYCRMERHGGKHDPSVECGKLLADIAELEKPK